MELRAEGAINEWRIIRLSQAVTVNDKAKICVATTVHYHLDTRVYYRQVCSLSKVFTVDYYAPCKDRGRKIHCSGSFFPLYLASSKLGRIVSQLQLCWLLLRRQYSIYHFHDPELIPLGVVLSLAGKTVIFDVHENVIADIGTKPYMSPMARGMVLSIFARLFTYAQEKFDMFILAEKSYTAIMETENYGVVLNLPILRKIEVPESKRWKHGMVYVGSITEERGIFDMLEVFCHVNGHILDSTLHLVGPIDGDGLHEKIGAWLKRKNLKNEVVLHGRIPNEEIFEIVRHNGLGLCLLKRDTFRDIEPTKLYEYMMAGIPVVASDCPLWRSIVEDCECGLLVNPDNHLEAAESVIALLEDSRRLEEFGRNGLRAIQERLNWNREEEKLLSLYGKLQYSRSAGVVNGM